MAFNNKQFPARGYIVVGLGLPNVVLKALQDEATRVEYVDVFDKVGGETDDSFRAEARGTSMSPAVKEPNKALMEVTSRLDAEWEPDAFRS